ncbi:hypothetical protein BH23GEM6_BH23GEM6_16590 [soil metagenome]
MLEDLQRLFRKSLAAFRDELNKREPEDQVSDLLTAMRREMVAARAALPVLKEDIVRSRAELQRERALLEQCERRLKLAERIGDQETVSIAHEFAVKHRERAAVLEQKAAAAEAEEALRTREAEEMQRKYRASDANRFVLVAQLRRQQTAEKMGGRLNDEAGPFADFARMEESVLDSERHAAAAEELDGEMGGGEKPRESPASEVEARLEEMKRRLGRE